MTRTVYVLPAGTADDSPQPAQIKIGISDGVNTEVLEGLKEGDNVVTARAVSQRGTTSASSPFGGMRRF